MTDEENELHVLGLVNQINMLLTGEGLAESATALTIAVTCHIVATSGDVKERVSQCREFASQLEAYVQREDFVEWIKYHTTHVVPSRRGQ